MANTVQAYLNRMEDTFTDQKIKKKVKNLNSTLLHDIGNQIIQSRIVIPAHQKKLHLKMQNDHAEHNDTNKIDEKYNQIKTKKKALLQELQAVEMMESNIKLNRSTLKHNTSSIHFGKNAKIRSKLTEDQLIKIKQIYKNQKKFQRKLQSKLKKHEEQKEEYRRQLQEQEREKVHKLCLQRHEQRQKYVKQIHQRNKKREELIKKQTQKIIQLKNKQKLHQKLENKFLEEINLQRQQIQQKLKQHKKKREQNFDQVKEHEEKYLQEKRQKDQEREQRLRNFKNVNQTKFPCLFLEKVKDEHQRQSFERQQKAEMVKTFIQKKIAYGQDVRKQLHKNRKTMSESKMTTMKQSKIQEAQKWLNTPQKYIKGTTYMREVNSKVAKLPRKVIQVEQIKPRFKNYLVELKNQNKQQKQQAKEKNIENVLTNISITAAKQNITSSDLAKSVQAKIELMNKLQSMR